MSLTLTDSLSAYHREPTCREGSLNYVPLLNPLLGDGASNLDLAQWRQASKGCRVEAAPLAEKHRHVGFFLPELKGIIHGGPP